MIQSLSLTQTIFKIPYFTKSVFEVEGGDSNFIKYFWKKEGKNKIRGISKFLLCLSIPLCFPAVVEAVGSDGKRLHLDSAEGGSFWCNSSLALRLQPSCSNLSECQTLHRGNERLWLSYVETL